MMMMVMMMFLFVLNYDLATQHRWRRQIHIGFQWMRIQGLVQQHIAKDFAAIIGNFRLQQKKKTKEEEGEKHSWLTGC